MGAVPIDETVAAPPPTDPSSPGSISAVTRPLLGDRYEILGLLGAGGMGNVYKARDLELDELVALKVLRPELVGAPGVLDRFRREVKLARRITHPNVARVFDIGERGGEKILTMELVDGESLAGTLAREGRLGVTRAVEVASAICAGLGAAHAAGVIHRDLKPDNVLVEKGGRVVLTDFGIARAVAPGDATSTAAFVGTPAYMAPEQIEGGAVDARTDVYAFGAMFYEMLTGERPWQGETVFGVAAARLLHPPPDARARRPDLPAALAALVLQCMARRPEDRCAAVAEIASTLATITLPAPAAPSIAPAAPRAPAPAAAAPHKRVAVLPFRNAGPSEHDYLADGLTEDVIDALSMAGGLRVRSRGVVMRYKGADRDAREIGRELDVQVVVDGTVRRTAGGVRISARLISVADGVQLWARRFDRPDAELLGVSDDTARAIAEALTVDLGGPARRVEASPEAMDLYLRARSAYHRFFDDPRGTEYLALFTRALELAPDNPRILAGYAMARARAWSLDPAAIVAAQQAAERAAGGAPEIAETHLALGCVRFQTGDDAAAVRALRHAVEMQPACGEAHDLLGRILAETHRSAEARTHLSVALAIDPDFVLSRLALARLNELLGRHDEADRLCEERPESTMPGLGRFAMWRRDARLAAELLPKLAAHGGPVAVSRAMLEAAAGRAPDFGTLRAPGDPSRVPLRSRIFFAQLEAEMAAASGEPARALAAIERAAGDGSFDVLWIERCPLFAELRADQRFLAARAAMAARAAVVEEAYVTSG